MRHAWLRVPQTQGHEPDLRSTRHLEDDKLLLRIPCGRQPLARVGGIRHRNAVHLQDSVAGKQVLDSRRTRGLDLFNDRAGTAVLTELQAQV